jgi:hypothetical protein
MKVKYRMENWLTPGQWYILPRARKRAGRKLNRMETTMIPRVTGTPARALKKVSTI